MFKVKTDENGHVEHYKARLVVQGYTQQKGADCDETFCPVVSIESLRVMIAIAVHNGLKLDQVDKMYGLVSQSTLTRYWRNLKCKAPSQ